jgi:hypothetical protein
VDEEMVAELREIAEQKRKDGAARRVEAGTDFTELRTEAGRHGIKLLRHSQAHYQVRYVPEGWMWNVYPGNRRIFVDRAHRVKGTPRLSLPAKWTLKDVVESAIKLREALRT